nr:MAG TPA: hypothetical protein [Caudoviricetes sp.]
MARVAWLTIVAAIMSRPRRSNCPLISVFSTCS